MNEPSLLVEVFRNYLGNDLHSNQQEQIATLPISDAFELADEIDKTLAAERLTVLGPHGALPIVYGAFDDFRWIEESAKRVQRLALIHEKVFIPCRSISDDVSLLAHYELSNPREPLLRLHEWVCDNAPLIESAAVVPFASDVYSTKAVNNACFRLSTRIDVSSLRGRPSEYAPVVDQMSPAEREDIIRSHLHPLFTQLQLARKIDLTPVFADYMPFNLWHDLVDAAEEAGLGHDKDASIANVLTQLTLPRLDDLSSHDIVALRRDSEAFDKLRTRLQGVLSKTASRLQKGDALQSAFDEEKTSLVDAQWAIEQEIKDSRVLKRVQAGALYFVLGAVSLTMSHPLIESVGLTPATARDLVKLGPSALVPLLYWLLFQRPRPEAALKFYEAFTSEPKSV